MNEYQRTLEMIYYNFKKSPIKVNHVEAIRKLFEEPCLRYREVHEVRWLRFYEALDAVYRTMDSLITYLSGSSDAQVAGLKKRVGQELFISITYDGYTAANHGSLPCLPKEGFRYCSCAGIHLNSFLTRDDF